MDWLRDAQWLGWAGAALVLGLIELATLDLVFVMLAGAAAITAVTALLGAPFIGQVLVFAFSAAVLVWIVRPIARHRMDASTPETPTNAAAHIGRAATVLERVTAQTGLVKLQGEVWTARAAGEGPFEPGETVHVTRIDGATAIVDGGLRDHGVARTEEVA